jgi:perosamine synthetase
MILFNDKNHYNLAKVLRDHGNSPQKKYWHEHIGYNYRMINMQAAIGLAQLERADEIIKKKIEIGNLYMKHLENIKGIYFVQPQPDIVNTFWLFSVVIDKQEFGMNFDELMVKLKESDIDSRPLFYPIHMMPPYKLYSVESKFSNAIYIGENGFSLPSSLRLSVKEIAYICSEIRIIATNN